MLSSKLGTGASAKFKFLNNKNPFKTPGSFSSTPASSNASPHNNTEFNTPINLTGGGDNANDLNISNSSLNNRSFPSIEDEINNYYEFEENEISQELRMELEQENEELLEELESDMNQVRLVFNNNILYILIYFIIFIIIIIIIFFILFIYLCII